MRRSKRLMTATLVAPACGLILAAAAASSAPAATVELETIPLQEFDRALDPFDPAIGDGLVAGADLDALDSRDVAHVTSVDASPGPAPTTIPLPPALWGGSALMGLIGIVSKFRKLI